jgi:beta-phosphoglucomutase
MLRAVIFDFDGVITDSEILHLRAFNQMLGDFGLQTEISKEDYYNEYLGLSDRDLIETLNEQRQLNLNKKHIEKMLDKKKHLFEILAKSDCYIIAGVREFLQMLREAGVPLAICSGALLSEIELILESNRLSDYFEVIVSAEQVKRGKPYPDGFELTLKKLNQEIKSEIKPSECIVVEDSHWGLDAAKAAGMKAVAVTNSYDREKLSAADIITDNLENLTIAKLNKICK